MEPIVLVLTTVGSEDQGIQIAETLVEKGHAACVNIIKRIRSIYRWKGEIWDDEEFLLVIKTRESLFEAVRDTIRSLHSYELPEVLCVPITRAEDKVQAWILDATLTPPKREE
ncbi:MAG: divalent-cation tolerance protein CutA [Acidobacteriota bacterium]|jgi:periplasmic divalent cation tolerance protein